MSSPAEPLTRIEPRHAPSVGRALRERLPHAVFSVSANPRGVGVDVRCPPRLLGRMRAALGDGGYDARVARITSGLAYLVVLGKRVAEVEPPAADHGRVRRATRR